MLTCGGEWPNLSEEVYRRCAGICDLSNRCARRRVPSPSGLERSALRHALLSGGRFLVSPTQLPNDRPHKLFGIAEEHQGVIEVIQRIVDLLGPFGPLVPGVD